MIISSLCGPAIIYIGFSLIQIVIDLYKSLFSHAFIKFIVMLILALVINILCDMGHHVIAWFLVFIPIIMMTIVSTLLLGVFGTNPSDAFLKSQVVDISNNLDGSGNYYAGSDILKTHKNAQNSQNSQNSLSSAERLDRDEHRKNLYDKVEDYYDLSSNENSLYDLSNNLKKYNIVDQLVNDYGNSYFMNSIRNSSLFRKAFNNGSSYGIGLGGGETGLGYSSPYSSSMINPLFGYKKSNAPHVSSLPMTMRQDYELREDHMDGTDFESYGKKYDEDYLYLGGDGFLAYRQSKFNSVKAEMEKTDPGVTEDEIDKEIEKNWQNSLSTAQRRAWNNEAQGEEDKSAYDPTDFTRYRSPLIAYNYSRRSSTDSANPCPPGKTRNSLGTCVRPCPIGLERKFPNGECEEIE